MASVPDIFWILGLKNRTPATNLSPAPKLAGVRTKGLEPPRRKTPDPKSGAATNYATCASRCKVNKNFSICKIPARSAVEGAASAGGFLSPLKRAGRVLVAAEAGDLLQKFGGHSCFSWLAFGWKADWRDG